LLVFSGTFIFGFIYVLLSRCFVQWQFSLPDVPATIAGLLGISGGTTVASAGLTAARGAKGAGLQQPTGADLISTGGVVVPERFQFFVWTLVSCAGFISLLVSEDPAKVNNFPDLPSGLLYVMGVSAAGYLGGKAARKPGPVLENAGVRNKADGRPWPALTVQGQNLASSGRFFIDEKELGFASDEDRAKAQAQLPEGVKLPDKFVQATPQLGASDTDFSTQLDIVVLDSSIDITQGDHIFRIVNRDGQFADLSFSMSQPSISSVYEKGRSPSQAGAKILRATDQSVTVVIKGSGLAPGSEVKWRAPGAVAFTTQSPVPGAPGDGMELWVSLVPGTRVDTEGLINVVTPKGFVASASVQVVNDPDGPGQSQTAQPQTATGDSSDVAPAAKAPAEGPHLGGK